MHTQSRPFPLGWRRPVWVASLVAASILFSLGFACAVPFAAFAAVAALTMTRRDALLLVGLVWFANQAVGFGVLHYPWTAETLAWGAGLLAVALLATLAAEIGVTRLGRLPRLGLAPIAFLSAFATYEGLLFLASVAVQGGDEAYDLSIVARIFAINAVAFGGLVLASKLGETAGLVSSPRGQAATRA